MVAPLYTTASGLLFHAGKILVLTVGLPARGKTHVSRALERYLRWTGVKTQVISLGDYRRKVLGGAHKLPSDYFTLGIWEKSPETVALRQKVSDGCEQLIWDFFDAGGQVVIYDANNGSRERRQTIAEKFDKAGIHVIMLESLCDDEEIIMSNIRSVKISSPDYRGWDPEKAVADYYGRIRDHEVHYEPVEETTWPFIRIKNVGETIMVNVRIVSLSLALAKLCRCLEHSWLSAGDWSYIGRDRLTIDPLPLKSKIVFFLMNIHNRFRTIYFARSGQSLIEHSYKADSDLSPAGWDYAARLKEFVLERRAKSLQQRGIDPTTRKLVIWTSARRRSHHSAWPFLTTNQNDPSPPAKVKVIERPQMSEINPGVWDGLNPDEVGRYYPDEWERFVKDPYAYRAPRAESYHDLCVRLEPTLIELEREREDLLIIGHASVIRCILAYLIGLPASEIPAIEVARGDLLEVVPTSYGVHSQAYHFWDGPGRSDTRNVGTDEQNFYENYAEDTKGKRRAEAEHSV
ncbi:hypothetical protein AcW1_009606 [Taiwanofungus camphoratus]|nr:hypothetical protein AcV5_002492 [Antrodia cinnamomea]KAI0942070.1 hypothetical protein AcV7_002602 [Antrodia cinnamomea]KAI0947985.1 hypothetical protein AcW1_009606 [Antrodia cinnamomea]